MPFATIGILAALAIVIIYNTIKILKEYERGVIFFLGRFQTVKGPGLIILIPGLQKMVKVEQCYTYAAAASSPAENRSSAA